jgi:hypothetical protein
MKDLEKYFRDYNSCAGDTIETFDTTVKRDFYNLKITPGFNVSSFSMTNNLSHHRDLAIKNVFNFRIGTIRCIAVRGCWIDHKSKAKKRGRLSDYTCHRRSCYYPLTLDESKLNNYY